MGLRAHSGWAALVVIAGSPQASRAQAIQAIDRRRIELVDRDIRWARQPYHAAQGLDSKGAKELVRRATKQAQSLARRALSTVIDELDGKGYNVVGCGVLLGSGRPIPSLEAALASHPMLHTAEGELFRNALIHASERCQVPVTGVRERELFERGAAELGVPIDELRPRLTELGRPLGPPWSQDEKHAALAAWLALVAASPR